MRKPDSARVLLDSFNSCKHEDRSLAVFEAEQLAARVKQVLVILDIEIKSLENPYAIRGLALILRSVLNGEEP